MVSRRGRKLWALAALLVLAGCTPAEGEETTTPTVSESPSDTVTDDPTGDDDASGDADPSESSSEPPEVEAPERPAAMDEETVDGAIAAAGYFVSLIPYVNATGDFSTWDSLSNDGCGFCEGVRSRANELHESGGSATGGGVDIYSEDGGGPYESDVYIVDLGLTLDAMEFHHGDGSVESFQGEDRPEFMLSMIWRDGSWLVTGVQQGSPQ